MDETGGAAGRLTRRRFVGVCAGAVALAGCSNGSNSNGSDGDTLSPPAIGDTEADVTVQVFEDYACPHCATYNLEGFSQIQSEYIEPGKIRYEHRDFPLPVLDPGSLVAANAAREVQKGAGVDAFYKYAKGIYSNYPALESNPGEVCKLLADDQGLDAEAVRTAGVNRAHQATVQGDKSEGRSLGVEGTPAFVVNGELVTSGFGSSTLGTVAGAIDQHL